MNIKRLSLVGFGPGDMKHMTLEAIDSIKEASVVVGYTTYIEIIKKQFPLTNVYSTGMGEERQRVKKALELADGGERVALVCSGDASLYGMAALAYELLTDFPEVEIKVIAGVTAALSGSALLGAVAGNDTCTISLSDYHTSKENIIRRLKAAAECDFVIALYNPRSKARTSALADACDVLLEVVPKDRVCGVARNIGRAEENAFVMTLEELRTFEATMFDTIFIGNSTTVAINGKMVTPRGYLIG